MPVEIPSPQTTLVVLLGASQWPYSPDFQKSEAFTRSVSGFKDYCLNPQAFALPSENLLDLFDANLSADDIDREIGQFLDQRIASMKKDGNPARDLLLYFVGHGGFAGGDSEYYLAIHRTRAENPTASGIRIVSLAHTLKEKARYLRRIVILDCCFAAAAFRAFQSAPAQAAILQTVDAFKAPGKGDGFPGRGTALLCSSRHNRPSLILPDGSATMFSKALLEALATGAPNRPQYLSLHDIASLTEDFLHELAPGDAPRLEVHSPDQIEGNIAYLPFFPNFAAASSTEARGSRWDPDTVMKPAVEVAHKQSNLLRKLASSILTFVKVLLSHSRLLTLISTVLVYSGYGINFYWGKELNKLPFWGFQIFNFLYAVGAVLFAVCWVLALKKTAQLGRWWWFFFLLFLNAIALPAYALVGPTTPTSQELTIGKLLVRMFRKLGFTGVKIVIERKDNED